MDLMETQSQGVKVGLRRDLKLSMADVNPVQTTKHTITLKP